MRVNVWGRTRLYVADETELEIQRFWDSAVHDLRAALRQIGMSTELLTKQTAETAQPVLGQLANGVAKMDSILSGVATESNELLHWAS